MRKPVVVVTGGSGGIGEAIVRSFAQNGYRTVLHYHKNEKKAREIVFDLQSKGYEAVCLQSELDSLAAAERFISQVHDNFGRVDVLINNAGVAGQKLFVDLTEEDWKRMFAVNLDTAFYCSKAVVWDMLSEQKGCIINVSSMWGQGGASMEVHYSASKAALIGLTKALAKELGPSGIRVNCVAPGVIDTPMNAALPQGAMEELCDETPLCRIGLPEDVAASCLFLAGEGGSFYTGQVLAPNGGLVI